MQGPLCHYLFSWASSRPVTQVRAFAMHYQFGTIQGANDPSSSCFQGIRYEVINGANVNYNIVPQSLDYDPRFQQNGVPGLLYASGSITGTPAGFFGESTVGSEFRSVTMQCPAGVNSTNLPVSFKLVVLGGGIPAASLNNAMDITTAPNADNVGTHWIMLPDRGVCVGDPALADQNDGSWIKYAYTPQACAQGCFSNPGAPVYANPPSSYKKRDEPVSHGPVWGPAFG